MSVLPIQKTIIAKDAATTGNFTSDPDGGIMFSVAAGVAHEVSFRFSLPRSTYNEKGLRITSFGTVYKLNSGVLSEVTAALHRITHQNNAVKLRTVVPMNSSTFILTPSAVLFRRTESTIIDPQWDNQTSGVSVTYIFTLRFVTSSTCSIELRGAEIMYDLSEITDGTVEAYSVTTGVVNTASISGVNSGPVAIGGASRVVIAPIVNVTQLTSPATSVTANGRSGTITTATLTTDATFTVNNTLVTPASIIMLTPKYSAIIGIDGIPVVVVSTQTTGQFTISIANAHSTNAFTGTIAINYLIL